jgi:carbon storage regulator
MLILTRRPDEAIVIAGGIRVRILSTTASRVRLAVDAPREIRVERLNAVSEPADVSPDGCVPACDSAK